jgi:RNA polymerase sigma factor (sigma-70 family)
MELAAVLEVSPAYLSLIATNRQPICGIYARQLAEMTAEEPDPQKELLYEKLAELPEEDQDLYRLYFTEGYSQEEIAKKKGVSQNTISKKLRRIARQLTEMCRNEV